MPLQSMVLPSVFWQFNGWPFLTLVWLDLDLPGSYYRPLEARGSRSRNGRRQAPHGLVRGQAHLVPP
jgi:hypothetical protein